MRTSDEQRRRTEQRIRAAADRLLDGDLPPGTRCDIKSLAVEAGVSRATLYTTYAHLKDEFETRRTRLQQAGTVTDQRQAQIEHLKQQVVDLRQRVAERDHTITEMNTFRTAAISRLAAQHEAIGRLRARLAGYGNVRSLRSAPNLRG